MSDLARPTLKNRPNPLVILQRILNRTIVFRDYVSRVKVAAPAAHHLGEAAHASFKSRTDLIKIPWGGIFRNRSLALFSKTSV